MYFKINIEVNLFLYDFMTKFLRQHWEICLQAHGVKISINLYFSNPFDSSLFLQNKTKVKKAYILSKHLL